MGGCDYLCGTQAFERKSEIHMRSPKNSYFSYILSSRYTFLGLLCVRHACV